MTRHETVHCDVTVVGGGLAGVCAAVAAARLGRRVTLVNNRPVLGGNSSSEVRVWVCGATGHGTNRYAREGGIMGELFVDNQYRNPEGNPYIWDLAVLELVRAEPNLTTYLNTDVRTAEAEGPEDARRITSVTGWTMGSERLIEFVSPLYLDCTGDGLVGDLAGARSRIGREGRAEYGEPWAPEEPDGRTLGSTLLFYTKDAGEPVEFVPPSFAVDVVAAGIPERRIISSGDDGCAYWWIEWGGELDTVHDNERIRDELWGVVYGIWDHIKNSGKFDADTMTLEWVGAVPGKREYRRLVGDYTLTQADIVGQTDFPDGVAFGGWSIDLHPPGGVYATENGSRHRYADGVYPIPYRCLYSANVGNLLMAGRNISASHVAFGSTRVMATCGTLGEAAGTAAALCLDLGVTPRGLAAEHTGTLRQTLLRQDASLIGAVAGDPDDLAPTARVTASSTVTGLAVTAPEARWPLTEDAGVLLPVDPSLDGVELLVTAEEATELTVTLHDTSRPQNYVPAREVATVTVPVAPGGARWVGAKLPWTPPDGAANAFLVVHANPLAALHTAAGVRPGTLAFTHRPVPDVDGAPQPVQSWRTRPLHGRSFCLRTAGPESRAWAARRVTDGVQRPYGGPHMWVSEPLSADGEWLELRWPEAVTPSRVELTFDDDVHEDLVNLHHHRTPDRVLRTLVRDYRVECLEGGAWRVLDEVRGNRVRHRVHRLGGTVATEAVRIVVTATNGAPGAHVVAVRAYR